MKSVVISLDEGVEIRSLIPDDAEKLSTLIDSESERLGEWMPWVHTRHGVDDTREYIEKSLTEPGPGALALWVQDELAGGTGLHVDEAMNAAEIGYWVSKPFEGRGLVSKACIALCDFGFGELGLHRIEICAGIENARSRAIPERLGFTYEGVLRGACKVGDRYVDLRCYSMLEDEWAARRGDAI